MIVQIVQASQGLTSWGPWLRSNQLVIRCQRTFDLVQEGHEGRDAAARKGPWLMLSSFSPESGENPLSILESEVAGGAGLIPVRSHPLLRHLNRSLVCRWLLSGKLTAIRMGSKWFSTDHQIRKFIQANQPQRANPATAEARHSAALARIASISARRKKGGAK